MLRSCLLALILLFAAPLAQAAEAKHAYIFEDAFVRETPARITAGYIVISNPTTKNDTLLSVEAPTDDAWAKRFELHTVTKNDKGVLEMSPVKEMKLPADGSLALRPGGLHIMIYDLVKPIKQGETKTLVLHFEKAGKVPVEFDVQPISYTGMGSRPITPASDHHRHH